MAESEDIKPADQHIQITITTNDGASTKLRVKRSAKCGKIFDSYHKAKGTSGSKFTFEGEEIFPDQTLDDLGIEDGAEIHAMVPQTGGR